MKVKQWITWGAAAVLTAAALTGCGIGKKNVFKIDKEACTVSEAKVFLVNYQNQYADLYGVNLWESDQKENLEVYIKNLTVTKLAEIYTMDLIAEDKGLTLTEAQMSQAEDAAKEYYKTLNDAEKKYFGISEKELADLYERYAAAQMTYQSLTENIDQEVSDAEAQVMKAQQIFVKSEDTAKKIKQQLDNGEDFVQLASSYNEAAKTDINLDKSQLEEENQEDIFALKDNQISGITAEDNGYYIFRCVKSYDAELTEKNKEKVLKSRMEAAVNSTYDTYVKEADSRFNEEIWKNVELDTSGELKTGSFFTVFEKYFGGENTLEE